MLTLSLLAAWLGACGGGHSSPTTPAGANLMINMTDAATDEVSQLNVYITGLTVKATGGSVMRIADNVGLVDLMALRNSSRLLAAADVQPGSYEFVQVDLDQSRSNVVDKAGMTQPLKIPSQEIKVLGGFTVMSSGVTTVTLDFKADQSLEHLGNGEWLLRPVIVQSNVSHG